VLNLPESAFGPVDGFVATRSATGIKTDTPIVEIPQSISVITADRMEQLGANTLSEALNYTAGVRSDIYGTDSRYDWLSIRGFDAYFPGFYFDGLFARNNNTWAAWKVEPYGAERIEVLKGPSSVLYGQMNPGGLVNIVTKRPKPEPFGEVGIQFGNFDRIQPYFDIGGNVTEDGKVLYRFTGLGLSTDTQVDYVTDDRFYLAPAVTFRPSSDTTLTVLGYYLDEKTGVTSNFLPAEGSLLPNPNGRVRRSFFSGEPNNDHFDTEQWAVSYFLEHRFNDVWRVRQNARYGRIDLDFTSLYGTGLDPTDPTKRLFLRNAFFSDESVGQFVIDNQAQANFSTGAIDHTLLMGVDYQNTHSNSFPATGRRLPSTCISRFTANSSTRLRYSPTPISPSPRPVPTFRIKRSSSIDLSWWRGAVTTGPETWSTTISGGPTPSRTMKVSPGAWAASISGPTASRRMRAMPRPSCRSRASIPSPAVPSTRKPGSNTKRALNFSRRAAKR